MGQTEIGRSSGKDDLEDYRIKLSQLKFRVKKIEESINRLNMEAKKRIIQSQTSFAKRIISKRIQDEKELDDLRVRIREIEEKFIMYENQVLTKHDFKKSLESLIPNSDDQHELSDISSSDSDVHSELEHDRKKDSKEAVDGENVEEFLPVVEMEFIMLEQAISRDLSRYDNTRNILEPSLDTESNHNATPIDHKEDSTFSSCSSDDEGVNSILEEL